MVGLLVGYDLMPYGTAERYPEITMLFYIGTGLTGTAMAVAFLGFLIKAWWLGVSDGVKHYSQSTRRFD
jgi:hypothetical protein